MKVGYTPMSKLSGLPVQHFVSSSIIFVRQIALAIVQKSFLSEDLRIKPV